MSVLVAFDSLVAGLDVSSVEVGVLVAAGRCLALEVDVAQVADENGRTRPVAAAVRELRALVAELVVKGSDGKAEDDWTVPA